MENLPACLPGSVHKVLMYAHRYSAKLTRQYNAKLAVQAALFCITHKTALRELTVTVHLFCLPHKKTHMQNSQLVLLCVVCPTRQHICKTVTYSYFVLFTWQESTCAELSPVDSADTKQVHILLQGRDWPSSLQIQLLFSQVFRQALFYHLSCSDWRSHTVHQHGQQVYLASVFPININSESIPRDDHTHNFGMVQLFLHEDETCVIKKKSCEMYSYANLKVTSNCTEDCIG